ncbi:MAG: HAMP domain-containing protein [Nitrospira sp.]|nr:HAMP domain-containing protein [Nitrospira sp.]
MKLRTKIALLTIAIAFSMWLITILSIRGVVIEAMRGELEKKAVSIARNLSDRVANSIILKDYFQTSTALDEVLSKEQDLEYIFVTDDAGRVFSHTFKEEAPEDVLTWNPLGSDHVRVQLLDTEKGYIRDVGVSVFKGAKSELHLGIREQSLQDTLHEMRYITFPVLILVLVFGVIASLIISRLTTKPLQQFVEFTKVLGRGDYGKKVEVPYGDEIGYLARNFNRLSMELKTASEKMAEAYTYTHLLQAEKLSSIGQISAGLAHELKNPMTTLKMLFQSFKEQPDMTKEDAEVINNEINRIDTILTNFIGFVRQKEFQYTDTDLAELVDRVLSVATYDIENRGVTVIRDMIDNLPHVNADRALLEQVFLNLILNAVQAMPGGGEIRISGKTDEHFVEIIIWDKGSGIATKLKSKIFDPFFTTKEQGTGLGLSIAYNIVKSHGGKLFFDSEAGKGTVFTVRLPKGEQDG